MVNNIFDRLSEEDKKGLTPSNGWIQWKGTDVCIDLRCSCGQLSHFDGEFLYYFECQKCKQVFYVGRNIKLIPLNLQELEYAKDSLGIKICALED